MTPTDASKRRGAAGPKLAGPVTAMDLGVAAGLLAVALLGQIAGGAYTSEVSNGADQPAHFLSGLMVRDYLAGNLGRSPLDYARDYYAHYPKVAIGNWPPVFYALQGVWMLVFPARPASVFVLLAVLAASVAWTVYRWSRPMIGPAFAAFAACIFLLQTPVPVYVRNVMAEIPLTLACTIAVCLWARFLETERPRDAAWFAACAGVAMLTKGNGFLLVLVPPLSILIGRRWRVLRAPAFWRSAIAALLLAVPWTWHYLGTMRAGWQFTDRLFAPPDDAWHYPLLLLRLVGVVPVAVMVLGMCAGAGHRPPRAPDRMTRDRARWASGGAAIGATIIFATLAPAGRDSRHLLPALPFVAMFVAAGAYALANGVSRVAPGVAHPRGMAIGLTGAAVGLSMSRLAPPRPIDGFGAAAALLVAPSARPAAPRVVSLVSSDAIGEGGFVVEMALRDTARPRHTVWRATKLLASVTWSGRDYVLRTETDTGVVRLLESAGVRSVLVDETVTSPHQDVLARAIALHPDRFLLHRRLPLRRGPDVAPGEIAVYEFIDHARAPAEVFRQVPGYRGVEIVNARTARSPR